MHSAPLEGSRARLVRGRGRARARARVRTRVRDRFSGRVRIRVRDRVREVDLTLESSLKLTEDRVVVHLSGRVRNLREALRKQPEQTYA